MPILTIFLAPHEAPCRQHSKDDLLGCKDVVLAAMRFNLLSPSHTATFYMLNEHAGAKCRYWVFRCDYKFAFEITMEFTNILITNVFQLILLVSV